jgi:hypothetical protein
LRISLIALLAAAVLRAPTLLAPDRLLERKERVSPPRFIGEECLPAIVESITRTLPDGSDRKPPFAVIRSTRSGKTRLLQEVANGLRGLRENGVVAIFVSFNGNETPFNDQVERDAKIAMLRRVSFALADQKLEWEECGVGSLEELYACQRPVVLVVDEINAVFRPKDVTELEGAKSLWLWLKSRFLIPNRQLVFSSHANDTYEQVTRDFVATDSVRPVNVLYPPLIDEPLKVLPLFPARLGVTTEAIALAGRIPGQIIGREVVDTKLELIEGSLKDPRQFALACLTSSSADFQMLPLAVRQVGLFERENELRSMRWTPYCITGLLRAQVPFLWEMCKAMAIARSNSGEIWEFFVALAIVLHRLAGIRHRYLAAAGSASHIEDVVRCDQTVTTWDALVAWVAQTNGQHLLVLPSLSNFPGVDLVEAVDGKIVGEYQLKTGDGKPSCAAHLPGAAWLMAGDPPGQPRVRADGWTKAGDAEMKSFLGDSLFRAIPKLWLEPLCVVEQAAKRVKQ